MADSSTRLDGESEQLQQKGGFVDVRAVQKGARDLYAVDPGASRATLRASSRKHPKTDSPFMSVVVARSTVIETAAHEAISVSSPSPCAAELLLSALAGCGQQAIQVISHAMKIPIKKSEVYVEGDLDFRGTLGISRDTAIGITALRVRFEIDAPDATPEQLASLHQKVERYCVIQQTFMNPPTLNTDWVVGGNMATLHQFVFSVSCEKVRRCMHTKGLRWRTVEVDWFDRSQLRALSGQTFVPILEHGGNLVGPDSLTVIDYVEKNFEGPTLFPGNSREEANVVNELVEKKLFALATRGFFPHAAREMNTPRFDADVVRITTFTPAQLQEMLPETAATYRDHLIPFDQRLATQSHIAGNELSAVDHILFANYWFACNNPEFRKLLDGYGMKNVQRWAQAMREDYLTKIPF